MAEPSPPGASGDAVGRRTFSTSFRGFDQAEVRSYLDVLAGDFKTLRARIVELEAELEDARAVPLPDTPVVDIATITNALGEQTARVLRTAQEAADDLRTRAEEGAARALKDAHDAAAAIRAAADAILGERTVEAEGAATRIRQESEDQAARLRHDATAESEATIADAIQRGKDMVAQAQAARERVLSDLARRRRVALTQIEQLRTGRQRLEGSLEAARAELNTMMDDLSRSDEEARRAAEAVGRQTSKGNVALSPDEPSEPSGAEVEEHGEPPPAPELSPSGAGTEDAGAAATSVPPDEAAPAEDERSGEEKSEVGATDAGAVAPEEPVAGETVVGETVAGETVGGQTVGGQTVGDEAPAPDSPVAHAGVRLLGVHQAGDEASPAAVIAEARSRAGGGEVDPAELIDAAADEARAAEDEEVSAEVLAVHAPAADPTPADVQPADTPAEPPAVDHGSARSRRRYRHDPVPAAALPESAVGPPAPEQSTGKVDTLFARIRADRATEVTEAKAVLAQPAPPAKPIAAPASPKATGSRSAKPPKSQPAAPVAEPVAAPDDAGLEAPRSDADESYLQRRDALIEPVIARASKSLKRALADDHNVALDRLRTLRSAPATVDALLGDEDAQVRAFARSVTAALVEAAAAGAGLALGDDPPAPDPALVAPVAGTLAADLVAALRTRVSTVLDAAGGDKGGRTVDNINSAYRERRGRIDRAIGDAATEAVSAGFASVLDAGTLVRWVVEDVDGPCPDCDDNALAGPTPLGSAFPTGQPAPPAHSGCRCVLARSAM